LHAERLDSYIAAQDDKRWFPVGWTRPSSDAELRDQTFAALRRFNVVRAVTSDEFPNVQAWRAVDPQRIVPALMGRFYTDDAKRNIRARVQSGDLAVLGEVTWQYDGHSPSDEVNEPFWSLAEELDVPVGIHMGLTPAGWSQTVNTKIRARLGSPLLLEDALIKHPKARVYMMHAGWPLLDETMAMLQAYPTLYVDVAWIDWYIPRAEFHTYLRRLVEAGFGKRIMFGSDQMQWPQAIGVAIESIESASFLTPDQKRDVLCRNAMRFFRFDLSVCE
jgi:predicted TIM-barrel fold metal-dependent hydrolase